MPRPRLSAARHVIHGGRPCLSVEIEGRPCLIDSEFKQATFDAGLVFVGEEFADLFPRRGIVVEGRRHMLDGFSADPRLFRLFRDYLDDFREGPVPIPD